MSSAERIENQITPKPDLLFFHPGFNVKKPGDIIIKAEEANDGGYDYFYFRLPLLAEFSSFFRNLPSPITNSDDTHDGLAVVPLLRATSGGLALYLDILLQLVEGRSGDWTFTTSKSDDIFNAAVLAKTYDTRAVSQQLLSTLTSSEVLYNRKALHYFGVCAIGYDDDTTAHMVGNAVSTLNEGCVTNFPEDLEALEKYAPKTCRRLIKFHLRCASGLIALHSRHSEPDAFVCQECTDVQRSAYAVRGDVEAIRSTRTWAEVTAIWERGGKCESCRREFEDRYYKMVDKYLYWRIELLY